MARRRYPGPSLAVDAVWISGDRILLVRRGRPPFRGMWALPGGFVESGESVEQAVIRELKEETNLRPRRFRLLGVYSRPGRDPRGPTASVVFRMYGPRSAATGGSDAREADWVPLAATRPLAFDHAEILRDALRNQRSPPRLRRPS